MKSKYTPEQQRRLTLLATDFEEYSQRTILDACNDRDFCKAFNLDYSHKYLYGEIELILNEHKLFGDGK